MTTVACRDLKPRRAGRPCTICPLPARREIDIAVVSRRATLRQIAAQYGAGASQLSRHARKCVPEALERAAARRTDAQAASLADLAMQALARSLVWEQRAEALYAQALEMDGIAGFGPRDAAIQTGLKALTASARVVALLRPAAASVNVHVLLQSPQWAEASAVLLRAVASLPGGPETVREAIRQLEAGK